MSKPRLATSVATRIDLSPVLNEFNARSLSYYCLSPCIDVALNSWPVR